MCWGQSGADVNWPSHETGAPALILASEAEDKEVNGKTLCCAVSGACHRVQCCTAGVLYARGGDASQAVVRLLLIAVRFAAGGLSPGCKGDDQSHRQTGCYTAALGDPGMQQI